MSENKNDALLEYLVRGFMTLQNTDECIRFLRDLCTESELQEMSRRLQAAKMLRNGRIYADIAEDTGLSTATISRVNRCLKYGTGGGYLTALERLEKEDRRR
ncbi:MAG: helix-turn-helix domain-containing protein [Clostridia bacterium]|nr:helix-turn-helix domain-containing protein [Clostridia bacterium]